MMFLLITALIAIIHASLAQLPGTGPKEVYYGTPIGRLQTHVHGVSGDVYAVDESTIFIKNFNYDGQGPDAYFWGGNTPKPDESGFIIPDEKGSTRSLGAYHGKDLVLRLPEGKTLRDIRWLSVWCRKFKVNFGELQIPRNLPIPSPVEIPALSQLAHGVKSAPVTIVDAQTFLVPDFHYDGEGPAGYWWTTRGQRQGPNGLRLKDENGSPAPLRRYSGETVVISLPDDKTIYDFDLFGVWCEEFNVDFGHVRIPQHVRVPPSPKMLGIRPETKLNCEVLHDDLGFELRWVMDGDDIVMQLVGKVGSNEYMAFGFSKDDSKSNMVNADAAVTWVRPNGEGKAVDYFLGSKEQCVGTRGSCPDIKQRGTTDSITLLHAAIVNGFSMVTFKRPQLGVDEQYDQHVYSDGPQAVMWAIGPLNQREEVSYHRLHNNGDMFIDFARSPKWNCPSPDASILKQHRPASSVNYPVTKPNPKPQLPQPSSKPINIQLSPSASHKAWQIPPIVCPIDTTFRAQIGPTGGQKGYQAITGKVGWGIAWYINGLLIPEMVLQRGKTYTFIVEGGNDPNNSARRHPLYLTDSPEGGFDHKSDDERRDERIYGGVGIRSDNVILPTAEGRLCEWKIDTANKKPSDAYDNFFDFQRSLNLECQTGTSGILRFSPDQTTPDLIYYQCYTHRNLGWKIRIVDNCEHITGQASIRQVYIADPLNNGTSKNRQQYLDTRVKPEVSGGAKSERHKSPPLPPPPPKTDKKWHREPQRPLGSRPRPPPPLPPSPRPIGQIPPTIPHLKPVTFNAGPYHGPPPYLFGYKHPQIGGGIRFPSGPVSPIEHVFRPPGKQKLPPAPTPVPSIASNLHGGFVPMLIKTANDSIVHHTTKGTTPAPSGQRTNSLPFSTNSSVPFHSSFQEPHLDFSGFNISRYGDLTPHGPRPVQLKKPIVPLPQSGASNLQKVNTPIRYKITKKPLQGYDSSDEFMIPASVINADENSVPAEDVIHEYLDDNYDGNLNDAILTSLRESLNRPPQEDHMVAVERGSHHESQESRKHMAIANPPVQSVNNKEKYYGHRVKPMSSPPTTDDLVEVVDESPLKEEAEVSSKTTINIPQTLTKEELKNKTDHTILTDVLRLIAQNAPAIGPQHTHVEVHMSQRSKRSAHDNRQSHDRYNGYDGHDHRHHHRAAYNNCPSLVSNIILLSSIIIINKYF